MKKASEQNKNRKKHDKVSELSFFVADLEVLRNDLNSIPPKEWTNMNVLQKLNSLYDFSEISSTKFKLKEILHLFWDEKANDPNAPCFARKRALSLHNIVNLVIDSRPVLFVINSNIKLVL